MPRDSAHAPQLPLFIRDTVGYPEALTRYEAIRPVLKGERFLRQQSQHTGINYWRLWRDLQRFRSDGLLGLIVGGSAGFVSLGCASAAPIRPSRAAAIVMAAVPRKRRRS